MGGRQAKLPKGVSVRNYGTSEGTLWVSFTYNRKQYRESLGIAPTKSNIRFAEQLLSSVKLAIARGDYDHASFFPNSKQATKSSPTISELLDQRLGLLKHSREQSTYEKRRLAVENHLRPNFGRLTTSELGVRELEEWIKSSGLGRSTAQLYLSILNPILERAVVEGKRAFNPISHIAWGDLYARTTERNIDLIDPLSEREIAIALVHTGRHRPIFQFALFSGCRLQELPLINRKNIDWQRRQLTIDSAVGTIDSSGRGYTKSTKTNRARTIDLLDPALDSLRSISEIHPHGLFFTDRGEPYQLTSLRWYWKRALRDAGLRHRSVKQTRHTFASLMLSRGENPMWVAKQLGHTNLTMLTKHYGRWIEEAGERAYTPKNDWGSDVIKLKSDVLKS